MEKLKDAMKKHNDYQDIARHWCKIVDIPPPIFEFRFDPDRKYRADMAYPVRSLLIEVEGGVFIRGRHNRCIGFLSDMEKYNLMACKGYYLLRFTPQQVKNGEAFKVIKEGFFKPDAQK